MLPSQVCAQYLLLAWTTNHSDEGITNTVCWEDSTLSPLDGAGMVNSPIFLASWYLCLSELLFSLGILSSAH